MQTKATLNHIIPQLCPQGYNNIKDRLFIKFVHKGSDCLKNSHFTTLFDFAMTYHIYIADTDNTLLSCRVSDSMMNLFQIDSDRLHADALASMQKIFPEKICFMEEFIPYERIEKTPTVVLTTQKLLCGGPSILYPGALQKASEMLHGSLYLIPSSTEEFYAINDHNRDPERIQFCKNKLEGINEFNRNYDTDHYLTDTILHYDAKKHVLTTAEEIMA